MYGKLISNESTLLLANPSVSHEPCISGRSSQRPTLTNLAHSRLNQVNLQEGPVAERNEARALASYLINKYDLKSLLNETDHDISQSHEQFERFMVQIADGDPSLEFLEVDTHNELFRSDLLLTRFRDERLGVDIRVCKLPDVLKSVQNLVRVNNYGYISGFTQQGWANESGLRLGDKILSSGKTHLASASHKRLISGLTSSRDITLAPICFFHSSLTQYLIICTPLAFCKQLGLRAAT